ncbi:Dihydrofolate reductase [Candidatus Phytoplasma rubi]|uniref:dihydrofolate reductase n=1 Tax=Candidatus Phytoplasma rubi TaxID=399025 RepID=A0ABY7BUD7_9MOLU|nr:dihydrofolate reductase [Candidatus Phytoplasma rubi]WAN63329.1 Dihydrofolate reductase [Candidatus Phytoplasma rubi]
MISLIAALDSNFLIGDRNKLPWHYREDLLFFKKKSINQNVLMGLNTYKSLKSYYKEKPFLFSKVYVVSHSSIFFPNMNLVSDLKFFLEKYKDSKENIMIIGGSQIFKQSLEYAKVMYITHVLRRYKGDSFFPRFDYKKYFIQDKKITSELIFVTYVKKID